ncbi:hypothetical protein AMS68_001202 [Peltaster fructicola]|uniref:Major facilitator superfamily (MFS) profile domain-containing protein n=1 Tax=Peltaster fructicola TaxID=286661 RepID=A0A6H0XM28_9PEZI|nr:hypothetical protein AMS68_001202 [Peltaster fructicola]
MLLTQTRSFQQESHAFPTVQLLLLALVRLAEPIALTSIFPYAWKLVLAFEFGDQSNASLYAGILISAFALAESLTGMFWGDLSDRIGRKPVLIIGCAGTMASLIVVGLSTNFWVALAGRFLGGALNGNIGVIQTMVGELVQDPKHEPKAYAIMPFVWSVGTIIGPCIGGYFAQPAKNFPEYFDKNSIFGHFPYLLPNLICAGLMLASIIAGWVLLQETLPEKTGQAQDIEWQNNESRTENNPLVAAVEAEYDSYGTFDANDVSHGHARSYSDVSMTTEKTRKQMPSIFTPRVIMLTIALGIFTYHSMTYDHLLPIFLQDRRGLVQAAGAGSPLREFLQSMDGGLGLTTQQTGVIMSVNGLIALFIQAVIFPALASWLGIWKLLVVVTIGHPIAYLVVPFLAILTPGWLFTGIYACLSLRSLLSIVAYPLLLILLKEASPSPRSLGKINGLAASVGAGCRTLASPISGFLYGVGMNVHFTGVACRINKSAIVAEDSIQWSTTTTKRFPEVVIEEVDSGYDSAEERSPLLAH